MAMSFTLTSRWLSCLAIFTVSFLVGSDAFACQEGDQSIREFDKKMVATPAELFEALKTLQPESHNGRKPPSSGLSEIGKAGLEFFKKLPPEEQDKAWEFAEKYLRKNGVDSSASKALMDEFGIPGDIQQDLNERFKQFKNRSKSRTAKSTEDEFSRLLEQAKDRSRRRENDQDRNGTDENSTERRPSSDLMDKGSSDQTAAGMNSGGNLQNGSEAESKVNAELTQRRVDAIRRQIQQDRARMKQLAEDSKNGIKRPGASDEILKKNRFGDDAKGISETTGSQVEPGAANEFPSEAESPGPMDVAGAKNSPIDWQKSVQELLDKHSSQNGDDPTGRTGGDSTITKERRADIQKALKEYTKGDSLNRQSFEDAFGDSGANGINRDMIKKAKEAFSKSLSKATGDGSAQSQERLTARFDKILVKAAKRTLESDSTLSDIEVPDSLDSMLDKLIDRAHKSVSDKKNGKGQDGTRKTGESEDSDDWFNGMRNGFSENGQSEQSGSTPGERRQRQNQTSPSTPPSPKQSMPNIATPDFSPKDLLDKLPDLSKVNPKHVFLIVGAIGLGLLAIYLLLQNVVGDAKAVKARRVTKRLRNAVIDTPKDLVEAVDVFLVGKFGSQSSWWNDRHARQRLNSVAPKYASKIDDLLKDYVRARYMRAEVRLSSAEQQRYKQTLLELAAFEEKPVMAIAPKLAEG